MCLQLKDAVARASQAIQGPIIVYYSAEKYRKQICSSDIDAVLRICKSVNTRRINLVLNSFGGEAVSARRIAGILRHSFKSIDVYVPSVAISAGTLIAISSDCLHVSEVSYLTPVDPRIVGTPLNGGSPQTIAVCDIRSFQAMASDWFKLGPESSLRVFELLCGHFHPTKLGELFQANEYLHDTVHKLLSLSSANYSSDVRDRICSALLVDVKNHFHCLGFDELRTSGLNIVRFSQDVEDAMDSLTHCCKEFLLSQGTETKVASSVLVTNSHWCSFVTTAGLVPGTPRPIEQDGFWSALRPL